MADGSKSKPRDLTKLPIFTEDIADCASCELKPQCDKQYTAYAYRPKKFNGLMIIGEGPGQQEIAAGRPFVGQSGKLLKALLESVGIEMDDCYITNMSLCKPPPHKEGFHKDFPHVVTSCLGRLEAEIEAVRPTVIVTLGAAAFIAVSGYDQTVTRRVANDCEICDPTTRKVGPVLQCLAKLPSPKDGGETAAKCSHIHYLSNSTKELVDADALAALKAVGCTVCKQPFKNVRPKMIKCPSCGGNKTKPQDFTYFEYDYNVSDVAGAIFEPAKDNEARKEHQVSAWFGAQGVRAIVPTYHPSFLLRDKQFMAKPVQKHLSKAKRLLTRLETVAYDYSVTKDATGVRSWVSWAKKEGLNVACDIETEAKDEAGEASDARKIYNVTKIKCLGLAASGRALVIDTSDELPDNSPLIDAVQDFLEDADIPKTWHNGACYDLPVISRVWGIPITQLIPSYTDDTLAAHANLYPDEPHDLSSITFSFVPARAWKPARTVKGAEVHETKADLHLYNARDVIHTDLCREAMGVDGGFALEGAKMHRAKLHRVYEQDSETRRVFTDMTTRGLPIDIEKRNQAGRIADEQVNEALAVVRSIVDEHTRFAGSDKQLVTKEDGREEFNPFKVENHLIPILFTDLGFDLAPLSKSIKTGQPTTSEADLNGIIATTKDDNAQRFIGAILRLREHSKTRSTYIYSEDMQPWPDGRIHTVWKPWGARTGRCSSKPNVQVIPKWLRMIFEARDGRRIIGIDYDQLELRGMGAVTGDPELIRRCMFADGKRKLEPEWDPHSFVASVTFKSQFTGLLLKDPAHDPELDKFSKCRCQTCKRKAFREACKAIVYGLNYGAGNEKLLETIYSKGYSGPPITIEMVAHVKRVVFTEFPQVPKWREGQIKLASETQELRSPLVGRRRVFPFGDVPSTELYNYPIQSLGADIVNERMVLLYKALPSVDLSAFIFAQVHDALYVEASEDKAVQVAALMDEIIPCSKVIVPGAPAMDFTAASSISKNWKDAA